MELSSILRGLRLYSRPMDALRTNGTNGIYDIDEAAITAAPYVMRNIHWTMAGMQLTDDFRRAYGLPTREQEESAERLSQLISKEKAIIDANQRLAEKKGAPLSPEETKTLSPDDAAQLETLRARDDLNITPVKAVRIPHTHHDYTVARNHLVPYYPPERESLNRRKEEKIIGRSRSWIINAMPQLNVPWTSAAIDFELARFEESLENIDPNNTDDLNEKSATFRLIFGAIMTRFELLGRATTQGNTYGTKGVTPPPSEKFDPEQMLLPMALEPIGPNILDNEQLSPEQIKNLETEYQRYCKLLMSPAIQPFLRLALLKDMKIDRDGILIDFFREVSKPIRVKQEEQDRNITSLNIDKLGSAMQSIDEIHAILRRAMSEGESGLLFKEAAAEFVLMHGREYGLDSVDDITRRLDDYATLCKARAGIKGEDSIGYTPAYAKLSALEAFFNGQNGLLQSIKRASRGHSKDVAELRQLTTRGIKLMLQTAYTRIPSNGDAPSVWIPNLDEDAPPLERNLARQFLTKEERAQARAVLKEAAEIKKTRGDNDYDRFLNRQFSSVGCLEREMRLLELSIEENNRKAAEDIAKKGRNPKSHPRVAGSDGQDNGRGGRG